MPRPLTLSPVAAAFSRAPQAAPARQPETEIALLNAAFRDALDELAGSANNDGTALEAFLGGVVREITALLDLPSAALWQHDLPTKTARLRLMVRGGQILPARTSGHVLPTAPLSIDSEAWLLHVARRPHLDTLAINDPLDESHREQFAAEGVVTLLRLPLVVRGESLGAITVRVPRGREVTTEEMEAAQSLANNAALALVLDRYATENRDAALAREREESLRRENELLKRASEAQQAMHESLGTLTDVARLDNLLSQVLKTVVECLGEASGGLWLQDHGDDGYRHYLTMENGTVVRAESSAHPAASKAVAQLQLGRERSLARGDWVHGPQEIATMPEYEAFRSYLAAQGVRSILSIPLFAGETFLGTITVRGRRETFASHARAFAKALANQASTALHIARLAEQAKQVAVAVEQKDAARLRAETLARANRSIRATLDKLAEQQDLDAFLGKAVAICADELGAVGAGIWLRHEGGSDELVLSYEDGRAHAVARAAHPGKRWTSTVRADEQSLRRGEIVVESGASFSGTVWCAPFREYLEARGIVAIARLPLFIGERWAATIVLRYTSIPTFTEEQHELAFALGNQIALAMELTRLSTQERGAAIVRERLDTMTRTNLALRTTAEKLAEQPNLESFLGQTLLALVDAFGGAGGTFWRWDGSASRMLVEATDGVVRALVDSEHPDGIRLAPGSVEQGRVQASLEGGHIIAQDVATDPALGATTREYLRAHGVGTLVCVPLRLGDRHLGSFTIRVPAIRQLEPHERELAAALATQAAVAIELTRLAEAAEEAAVAREREAATQRRAAELANANEAMRATLTALTEQTDLDKFLDDVLVAICRELAAPGADLWLYDEGANAVTFHTACIDGKVTHDPEPAFPRKFPRRYPLDAVETADILQGRHRFETNFLEIVAALDADGHHFYASHGVRSVLRVPVAVGANVIGNVAIWKADATPFAPVQIGLALALAQQAALAIHTERLAEQAKRSAVAQAEERAAEDQVAELTRANGALSRTIDTLARERSIDAFLAITMGALAEALESTSLTLWLYKDRVAHLHLVYENGQAIPGAESAHPNAKKPIAIVNGVHSEADGVLRRAPVLIRLDEHPMWTEEQVTYLRARGVRALIEGVMVVDDRVVGTFTARLLDGQPDPPPARMSLVQALASQAALAIEMTRLADQARVGAVVEERNRLARDIHDTLAQGLAAIVQQLEAATATTPGTIDPHLTLAMSIARDSFVEARRSIRALRPQDLTRGPLVEALGVLVGREQALARARLVFATGGAPASLPPEVEDELLRIAAEALTNTTKHAAAAHVTVDLAYDGSAVRLTVRDDGVGFDVETARGRGVGLASMRERAARVGATVTFASEPGDGAEVIAFWAPRVTRRAT